MSKPDKDDADSHCEHIAELPKTPTADELSKLRSGLRKRKVPEIFSGWHGRHAEIGQFKIISVEGEIVVEWTINGQAPKKSSLGDLCSKPERELDRLDFGWMVANMTRLDKIHRTDAIDIPHPLLEVKEKGRVWNYFEKIEKRWRHWAIVPAGYMIRPFI